MQEGNRSFLNVFLNAGRSIEPLSKLSNISNPYSILKIIVSSGFLYFSWAASLSVFVNADMTLYENAEEILSFAAGAAESVTSLREKSVHDFLFLARKLLAFIQAVGLAFDVDYGAMMQDAIQNGGSNSDIGKDLVPLREGFVGGKNGRSLLIPSGDELKEQVCALNIHEEITDLVNDEHPVLGQNLELVRQTVFKMGLFELLNELMAIHVGSVHISASTIRAR